MDDLRKAFEYRFPTPLSALWNGERYLPMTDNATAVEEANDHQARWEGWQAATANLVRRLEVLEDLVSYQNRNAQRMPGMFSG